MSNITEDNMGNLPRFALFRGRKVRIAWYEPGAPFGNCFHIVLWDDSQRAVKRTQLTFMKPPKDTNA